MTLSKLRRPQRAANKLTPERELVAWHVVFAIKNDYFGDLAEIGLNCGYVDDATIRDAWQRLGAMFLKYWRPGLCDDDALPYAWRKFGPPPGWEGPPPPRASLQEQRELGDAMYRAAGMKNARMLGGS